MKAVIGAAAIATAFSLTLIASFNASAQDPAGWGDIKGRIVWGGDEIPKQVAIDLGNNAAKAQCCMANKGEPPVTEKWVVNAKNKGIRDVGVWLVDFNDPKSTKPLPTHPDLKDPPKEPVVIDQPACTFLPHAVALREGQTLLVKNSADFPHNFRYLGHPFKNPGENFLMPAKTERKVKLKADRIPVQMQCNIHPWMNGWIRVFNHPYFDVTDKDGDFEMKKAPAGQYRLMIWHSEGYLGGVKGKDGMPITIKAGETLDLGTISFPPPAS